MFVSSRDGRGEADTLIMYSLAVHLLGAALGGGPGPVDLVIWRGVRSPLHAVGPPGDVVDVAHRPAAQNDRDMLMRERCI